MALQTAEAREQWRIAKIRARRWLKFFDESEHPRDSHGRFTDAGGGDDHPGEGYSSHARLIDGVIHTDDVYDAARALHEDRDVELTQPRTASILIDRLGVISKDMIDKGEKAPNFNLCRVTIKGTSLFCADTQGIPRVEMPQIAEGDEQKFREYLESKGYAVSTGEEFASYLRATQNELNGRKVAGIASAMREDPTRFPNPVFVSRDNYILDGHHRWGAKVGIDAEDNVLGNTTKIDIVRVDISITELLKEADEFTGGAGKVSMSDDSARPQTDQRAGTSASVFAKVQAAVNAIPETHAAKIAHVPVVLSKTSDEFPSHVAAGGGSSTVGLFGWGSGPRIDIAESVRISVSASPSQAADTAQTETMLPVMQPEQVTVHELAHALDHNSGWAYSADTGLAKSIETAVGKMTEREVANAQYWIRGGPRETFAELYSVVHTPKDSGATFFGGMSLDRAEQVFASGIGDILKLKKFSVVLRASAPEPDVQTGWWVNEDGQLYALLNGMPYPVDVSKTKFANVVLVPGTYRTDDELMNGYRERSAHSDWMDECVSELMGYGKDQIVAVAACLNMWRDAWEISHPDGADDPGPSPKEADEDSPLARRKGCVNGQNVLKAWDEQDHPRHPAGSPEGGQFVGDGGGGGAGGVRPAISGSAGHGPAGTGKQPERYASRSPRDSEGLRDVVAVYEPTPETAAALKAKGATPLVFHELSGEGAEEFHANITAAKIGKFGAAVTAYPVDDYLGMRMFVTPDGLSGFALKGDDIVSLFKHPNSTAQGVAATSLMLATDQGGRRLDAFDTMLPDLYSKSGFHAVARLAFNDEFAPDGWDYDAFKTFNGGRPDIVFMAYNPDDSARYVAGEGEVITDYDEGATKQAEYLAKLDEATKPRPPTLFERKDQIRKLARETAVKLDFNPAMIEYSNEDLEFKLGDANYKYAGSYLFGDNKIKLYNGQISPDNVTGITAHEIGHRKFDLLTFIYKMESDLVMKDPGPPPDPDHRYWWGKRGGSDAIMTPDGTLRPPYDTKYPTYHEWQVIQNMRPSLEQDDGISNYSKAYWREWEGGKMSTNIAYHETMAEISRSRVGGLPRSKDNTAIGAGWKRLYALQESVWKKYPGIRDISALPVKMILILDDIRWEVR